MNVLGIRLIGFLFALALYFVFAIACLYGVFLLAKIRTQATGISRKLDDILARMSAVDINEKIL
jgi:hypothetical protein